MTASDKEYVEMTAKLTAQETVKEFRLTLNCNANSGRIGELEQVVNNGIKDRGEENAKAITRLRKFVFYGILGVFILALVGAATQFFTG